MPAKNKLKKGKGRALLQKQKQSIIVNVNSNNRRVGNNKKQESERKPMVQTIPIPMHASNQPPQNDLAKLYDMLARQQPVAQTVKTPATVFNSQPVDNSITSLLEEPITTETQTDFSKSHQKESAEESKEGVRGMNPPAETQNEGVRGMNPPEGTKGGVEGEPRFPSSRRVRTPQLRVKKIRYPTRIPLRTNAGDNSSMLSGFNNDDSSLVSGLSAEFNYDDDPIIYGNNPMLNSRKNADNRARGPHGRLINPNTGLERPPNRKRI